MDHSVDLEHFFDWAPRRASRMGTDVKSTANADQHLRLGVSAD
jgi:hypothetical protein